MFEDILAVRTPARILALLLVPGIVVACGDGYGGGEDTTGPADDASPSASATVDMTSSSSYSSSTSFGFNPRVDTISVGDTVAWTNGTSATHTVDADDGEWGSQDISANGSYQRVFTEAGEHPYHCTHHGSPGQGMHGTIVVEQ